MRVLLFSFLATAVFSSSALAAKYELDKAHTNVSFQAPHLVVSKVNGRFDRFDGSFDFDEQSMKLDNVVVNIKTDSINTNEKDRDKDLRSKNFFDVTKYPDMKFKSTKVEYDNGKPDKVLGDLTIRGVTKPVVLEVEYNGAVNDPWGNRMVSFEAETKVDRREFGMTWNKALDKGGWLVGDEIKIKIEGEAKMASAPSVPAKKK
ncbi:YceI family protein [Bdellovibrio bacteriovorus]|uniref:YceI family protein n=1 Tax=Bdellovibrio TaxID=958 RepID=UPI0035A83A6E